ncbi:acyltransferase [Pseudomonas defluvii]|uniref:acyltransferase n=1 Tax=Pseudomonas defluvii TaxID=1876757 RepID=UPI0008112A2A|nr:acyltransferase [Pseudomonas defluvii]
MQTTWLVEIGTRVSPDSCIGEATWVRAGNQLEGVTLGQGCFVGFNCHLEHLEVADRGMLATGVVARGTRERPISIGRGAWVGARATLAPGVRIGAGAVVAAGALVNEDVEQDCIVVGRPARIIARRQIREDGWPDPAPVLQKVLKRQREGLPSFLDPESCAMDRVRQLNPQLAAWRIGEGALIDAELRGGPLVQVGADCVLIGRSTRLGGMHELGGITLGEQVVLGRGVVIEGAGGVSIGAHSCLGDHVTLVSSSHDHGFRSLPWKAAPIRIGKRCHIGAGALIVGPVALGDDVRVEPYAVVIRDVPAKSVVKGIIQLKEEVA